MKIKLKDTVVVSLSKYPGSDGCTQVLLVSGLLTPSIAAKLKISECFDEKGIPKTCWDSFPTPTLKIAGGDVAFDGRTFPTTLLHKFKVRQPQTGNDRDTHLELSVRIHFAGKEPLSQWIDKQNNDTFVLDISAAQEDLQFEEVADEDEPEPDTNCTSCNNGVELGFGNIHLNGQKCVATKDEGPALASSREVLGPKKKRTPGKEAAPGDDAAVN